MRVQQVLNKWNFRFHWHFGLPSIFCHAEKANRSVSWGDLLPKLMGFFLKKFQSKTNWEEQQTLLVGGWNPFETYSSTWESSLSMGWRYNIFVNTTVRVFINIQYVILFSIHLNTRALTEMLVTHWSKSVLPKYIGSQFVFFKGCFNTPLEHAPGNPPRQLWKKSLFSLFVKV